MLYELVSYLHQFVGGVVVEPDDVGEAAPQTDVGAYQSLHLLFVPGEDDYHVAVGGGKCREERLYDPVAEVFAVLGGVAEGVGLVYEEDVAAGLP